MRISLVKAGLICAFTAVLMCATGMPGIDVPQALATDAADETVVKAATISAFAQSASTLEQDGILYVITSESEVAVGTGASADAQTSLSGDIVVPETVSGYMVTAVSDYAFSSGSTGAAITSIALPQTIKSIGAQAFARCAQLERVDFGEGSALATIGSYAFNGCTGLTSLIIPSQVTSTGIYAFANCPALASLKFENPEAQSPALFCEEGAFALGNGVGGSLAEVTLPARLAYIGDRMFIYQDNLKSVRFAGTTTSRVGEYAFFCCTSLETLEIPELTSSHTRVGSNAFVGLNSLSTLVFLGDETGGLSMSSFGYASNVVDTNNGNKVVHYSDIKTIVYYGAHMSNLTYSDPVIYQALYYYDCAPTDEPGKDPLATVLARNDVLLKDVASSVGVSDQKGALVLSGAPPALGAGQAWCYYGTTGAATASTRYNAFPVQANDLTYGALVLGFDSLVYTGEPVSFAGAELLSPDGRRIESFALSVANESGVPVATDAVMELGTYTVRAQASGYSNAAEATFQITRHDCDWLRADGNTQNSNTLHMADTAFTAEDTDTVILVDSGALIEGVAAAGLAHARNAPILEGGAGVLSLEAKRNLSVLKPQSVYLVGYADATEVTNSIKQMLGSTVSVSNAFSANTPGLVSYNMYNRTKSAGFWTGQTHAVVASAQDPVGAVVAGAYCAVKGCPLFLVEADGVLPEESAKAIAKDFGEVTFSGASESDALALKAQLKVKGYTGSVARWSSSDVYAASIDMAQRLAEDGSIGYDKAVLVDPSDLSSMMTAVSVCAKNRSPMLFADNTADGMRAVDAVIAPNRNAIDQGYLFATRARISEARADQARALWSIGDSFDLSLGRIVLDETSFANDGTIHLPNVKVYDKNGAELIMGTSNESNCTNPRIYYDQTGRAVMASSAFPGAGTYTVTVTGSNGYYGSLSTTYAIGDPTVSESASYTTSATLGPARKASAVNISNATVKLSTKSKAYTGKAIKPAANVSLDGAALDQGTDFTLAYSSNTNPGKATVTVKGKDGYTGSAKATFKITYAGPIGTSISKVASKKKQTATVTWKVQTKPTTGYQIRYSQKSSMKGAKAVKVAGSKKASTTIKKLKSKKRYYFQVRTYKKIGSKVYYSKKWSKTRSVVVK